MQLTDRMVRDIQPTSSVQIISDLSDTGLTLKVQARRTDGKAPAKTYFWRGRINGKVKTISLGRADTTKVTKARAKAIQISNEIQSGNDPIADLRPKVVIASPTVDEVWTAYMDAEGNSRKSASEKWRVYRRDIQPLIGSKMISEMTPYMLAEVVNAKAKTAPIQAGHIQAYLSRFFRWSASSKGWAISGITVNPMAGVLKPAKSKVRERVLSEREIRWVLQACRELQDAPFYGRWRSISTSHWAMAVELLLRTGQRRSDVLNLTHEEIEDHVATLAGYRHKSGLVHKFWLTDQCLAVVAKAGTKTGKVFRCTGNEETFIQRIRKRASEVARREKGHLEHWTLHDLRRTVATTLADMADADERPVTTTDEIKKLLGHTLQGAIAHYLHGHALPMKKRLMGVWNEWLDSRLEPVRLVA